MIVKNEAENLPRCLDSVKDKVDEIVILDTGSTDATVEIAHAYQAQVQHFTWCNDFSVARNQCLKYASGDWILVLDADEMLAPEVMPLLRQAMQQENALVINLVRQEVGAIQSPYSLVSRLFRRHDALQFSRPYHALIDDSVTQLLHQEPHWQVLDLPHPAILHYGYEPGAIASRQKLQTAKAAMEEFWLSHPDDPYVCCKLGATYIQVGEFQQGLELLKRGLRSIAQAPALSSQSSFAPILYELHYHLGVAHGRLKQPAPAEQYYRAAIQQPILERLKLGAYNNLGSLLQLKGDFLAAQAIYETCLTIEPRFVIGHYNLGMTLKALGKLPEAVKHYQRAIELDPGYAEAYQNLGVALLKLGQVAESMQSFQQAIARHEEHNPQEAARLRQGLREMGFQV